MKKSDRDVNRDKNNVGVKHSGDMINRETKNIYIRMLHPAATRGLQLTFFVAISLSERIDKVLSSRQSLSQAVASSQGEAFGLSN